MKKIFSIVMTALVAFAVTSCVKDEIYPYASVKSISNTDSKSETMPVTVTVKAEGLVDVVSAVLYYNVDGGEFQSVEMTGTGGTFTGVIPANVGKDDQEVTYYAEVTSAAGKTTKSAINKYTIGQAPIDYTGLIINELNGNDKFIELYNGAKEDLPLAKIQMFKDGGEEAIWTAGKITIKKGEYLVLWTVGTPDIDDSLIFNAGLSAKKPVQITIKSPAGVVIDDIATTNAAAYAGSFGRNADGRWYYQATKTPGAKNVDGIDPLPLK